MSFWKSIEAWMSELFNVFIPLKITDVMFGIPHRKTQDNILYRLNFITIYGKWYIYINKKEQKHFTFNGFKNYLKHILSVEELVAINKNVSRLFTERWSHVMQNL